MILQYRQAVFTLALAFLVSACATHTVKTTSYTPVVQDSQDVPEDFLLDVGVSLFDPGIDEFLGMMKTPRTLKSVLRNPAMRRTC